MKSDTWSLPPDELILSQREVQVWRIELDWISLSSLKPESILSDVEKERSEQFHFEKDRRRFLTRRVLLREMLGKYLAIDPGQISFDHNRYGKPSLKRPTRNSIYFNVTHSEQMVVFAFSRTSELGVDVERINQQIDFENIAKDFFSPGEIATLNSQSGDCRIEKFYTFWTRKEAYIKGRGMGLSIPLGSFDVSKTTDKLFNLLEYTDHHPAAPSWWLIDLPKTPGFAGALAIQNQDCFIRYLNWK